MAVTTRGLFVTGSDTGVGKTWIARQLVAQLVGSGASVKVRKPVESGCLMRDGSYYPADGDTLWQANGRRESLDIVTPYRFEAALAPDRAASLEGQRITLQQVTTACQRGLQPDDFLLVEGAGGFYSPLCHDGLNADLATMLGLAVIVVCADRLGAINQALLTLAAVEQRGLEARALVLNRVDSSPMEDHLDNLSDLRRLCSTPVYHCAYQQPLQKVSL